MPTNSKWQIGLLLWLKALSRGLRLAAGGAGLKSVSLFSRSPSGDSKGRSPWRAFGDFPRVGKVTRGRRGGAPSPLRVWELCSHIGERRGAQPLAKATAPCAGHRAAKSPPESWRRGSPPPAPSAPLAQTAPAARPETRRGPDAAGSRAGRSPDRDG